MIKILHCADIHLDTPFACVSADDARARRLQIREVFGEMVEYALREGTRLFIISGDLFEDTAVTYETVSFVIERISTLPDCIFALSPGNHDPYHAKSPYAKVQFPPNAYIFRTNGIESFDFPEWNLTLYGYAFTSPSLEFCPFADFTVRDPSRINILAAHGELASVSPYCPISEKYIASSGLDYIALGHIHKRSEVAKAGRTFYAQAGIPQGRAFDETGEKGAYAGTVDKKGVDLEFIRFCRSIFTQESLDVTGMATNAAILDAARSLCEGLPQNTRLSLTLTGMVPTSLEIDVRAIENALDRLIYTEIRNAAIPFYNEKTLSADKGVVGMFFRILQPSLDSADMNERRIASLALKYGLLSLQDQNFEI